MRIPHELPAQEDNVCLALLQIIVCLFPVKDKSDGADFDFREDLLDSIRKGNLVSRRSWNLLLWKVSAGTDINQINSDLVHLRSKNLALFDTPGKPITLLVLFVSCPLCSTDSDEERLVRPRLADPLDQSERPTHAILQTLTAVLVGPVVGKRGEE